MTISLQWLQEYLELNWSAWPIERLCNALTDVGLEVEHIDDKAAALQHFVVGYVRDRQPHPKADKLSVCTVDVGEPDLRTIVCGAHNVAAGQFVPVAIDGAVVPNGCFVIGRRTLRGVESQGMICSQAELGLGDDHDGIWILGGSDAALTVGQPLAAYLGTTDVILEMGITPNRADCLSHIGVAREVAAVTGATLRVPDVTSTQHDAGATSDTPARVSIPDPTLCRRFMVRRIDGVRIVPSPEWLQRRLVAIGLRPRNAIVDITNYVMHECGQPLHAYDASTITDNTFVVQTAGMAGVTSYTTLDHKERTLDSSMLMICDAAGPVGVAGVMGGEHSEITDTTTSVLLESAWFQPSSIRRTAKTLGLSTDASYRFERGVDMESVEWALDRATSLIVALAGGTIKERVDAYPLPLTATAFRVRFDRVRMINGIDVSNDTIVANCRAIGCVVENITEDGCSVTPPSWRMDITSEIDIVEEVMRLYGVNAIAPATHARIPVMADAMPAWLQRSVVGPRMRAVLIDNGFVECRTTVQTSPESNAVVGLPPVKLKNPLGQELSMLRTSMIPGLLRAAGHNLRHGAQQVRLVEHGKIMIADAASDVGVVESERLGVVIAGANEHHWSERDRSVDVYDIVGSLEAMFLRVGIRDVSFQPDIEEPIGTMWSDNRLVIVRNGERIGMVGQVEPSVAAAYDVETAVFAAEWNVPRSMPSQPRYVPVSAYPIVQRDVAFVVDDAVTAGAIVETAQNASSVLVRTIDVFDVYRDAAVLGSGRKSLGISVTLGSDERTLTDADVDAIMADIMQAVQTRHNATIRGAG